MRGLLGVIILVAIAIAGLVVRRLVARIICWTLAVPPLAIGSLALWQGGIAEPFSPMQMLIFCSLAFLPAVGCGIGQFIAWRKAKPSQNTSPHATSGPATGAGAATHEDGRSTDHKP